MTRYWKALLALGAGLVVLLCVAVFWPERDFAITTAAVQTVIAALAVLAGPANKENGDE